MPGESAVYEWERSHEPVALERSRMLVRTALVHAGAACARSSRVEVAKDPGVAGRQIVEPGRICHVDPGLVHRENPQQCVVPPLTADEQVRVTGVERVHQVAVALVNVVARVVKPTGAGIEEDPFNPI